MSHTPFVVTVASEKGGVGKTTIATNLAVYLKALREDLPVTIASFDNHFSVDAMFAIGSSAGPSVRELWCGEKTPRPTLGEYGVQFFASERNLCAANDQTAQLGKVLAASSLGGILILDTRPILDDFTRSALAAADLVLTPIKDRASLVNVAAVQRALREEGNDEGRLWLLPSLIDRRLRLREGISMEDFLTFSARERGYQLAPTVLVKSPRVEGLATGFARRTYPVLTHARGTLVHGQFRSLAHFVLERFDGARHSRQSLRRLPEVADAPSLRRLAAECPLCGEAAPRNSGWFCEDPARRRRHLAHGHCIEPLLGEMAEADVLPRGSVLVVDKPEPGWRPEDDLLVRGFGPHAEDLGRRQWSGHDKQVFHDFLRAVCGRLPEELPTTRVLLSKLDDQAHCGLSPEGYRRFAQLRRRVLRQLRNLPPIG
ncbi:ParA family protein [Geoalkalibacter halelectricus]|uniref:ParA family protein n=1 Tax=Geoalkalibacter halelectricus TaxID=2847045 RepID=A0ABY5ZQ04_9BACT|nr:ParA family protein [Geoalkalibacter halelectricus]MDO3377020.1 ParA family protein [Geoalkalibacter halelectricus]UWZ81242.1 ParA family protein [Geoalkalibacter halelectricus]